MSRVRQLDSKRSNIWGTRRYTCCHACAFVGHQCIDRRMSCFQLPQERGGSAPSMSVERSKSWLPSMFHRSKHASRQKDVMKKLKDNLRCASYDMPLQD